MYLMAASVRMSVSPSVCLSDLSRLTLWVNCTEGLKHPTVLISSNESLSVRGICLCVEEGLRGCGQSAFNFYLGMSVTVSDWNKNGPVLGVWLIPDPINVWCSDSRPHFDHLHELTAGWGLGDSSDSSTVQFWQPLVPVVLSRGPWKPCNQRSAASSWTPIRHYLSFENIHCIFTHFSILKLYPFAAVKRVKFNKIESELHRKFSPMFWVPRFRLLQSER